MYYLRVSSGHDIPYPGRVFVSGVRVREVVQGERDSGSLEGQTSLFLSNLGVRPLLYVSNRSTYLKLFIILGVNVKLYINTDILRFIRNHTSDFEYKPGLYVHTDYIYLKSC